MFAVRRRGVMLEQGVVQTHPSTGSRPLDARISDRPLFGLTGLSKINSETLSKSSQ